MPLLDRTGTYRTKGIIDGGLGETSSGLPQLMLSLQADEIYDFEEKCWVDWSDTDTREITAYLVLIGKTENEIFHCKSIEKALGWDGASLSSLAAIDFQSAGIQFRVEENEYNDKVTLQVAGIDHYDAEPGRTVQKLDAAEVKGLDAKYASFFRKRAGERKPKTVGAPKVPTAKKPIATPAANTDLPAAKLQVGEPPKTPKKTAKSPKKPAKKAAGCTQTEAWAASKKAKHESISDDKLIEVWLKAVEILAPDGDEDKMSPELCQRVKEVVVQQVIDDTGL